MLLSIVFKTEPKVEPFWPQVYNFNALIVKKLGGLNFEYNIMHIFFKKLAVALVTRNQYPHWGELVFKPYMC